MIAELGYVAFCADIYGKGIRPTDPKETAERSGSFKSNLPLLRKRVNLAFDEMLKQSGVDKTKTAAIGYCLGGTPLLELGRAGPDVTGVVSFHGGLATSMPAAGGRVKTRVLVCHGADDPFVKPEEVAAFKAEMEKAKVSYEFISYPGAVHSFTKKAAGNDKSKGTAYNAEADKQSWLAMQSFFGKIFGKK